MFKLVVLCAFVAAATATPGAIVAPLGYSSNIIAPTVLSSQPSSLFYSSPVISSAPLAYSAPWGYSHLIKKRSAALALSSYIAPSTYVASAPYASTYAAPLATSYAAPLATTYTAAAPLATTYASPFYATAAHLIKKRSAPFIVPSTYITPTSYAAATPFVSTYAAAGPYVSAPLYTSVPLAYNSHFIKKRSAPLAVSTYAAPTSFSHTSRFDFQAHSPAITYSGYSSSLPLTYSNPLAFSHYY